MPDGYASARRSRGRGPADHRSKSEKRCTAHPADPKKDSHWNLSTESKICPVLPQLQAPCHCDEALRLGSIHSCTSNNAGVSTRFRKHIVTFIILFVPAISLSACKIWLLNSHPNSYMTPLTLPSASQSVHSRTKMHATESRLPPPRKCHLWARPHVCSGICLNKNKSRFGKQ